MINRDEYKGIKSEGHTLKPQVSSVLSHLCWANQSGSTSVCPITADCGQGYGSTPFFSDRKTEAQSPVVGIEEKKKKKLKRPPKRLSEVTHNPRVRRPAPFHFSVSHPQPAAFAMETVLPPSSAPQFLHASWEMQSTFGYPPAT